MKLTFFGIVISLVITLLMFEDDGSLIKVGLVIVSNDENLMNLYWVWLFNIKRTSKVDEI